MKEFIFPVTCDICGGNATGTIKTHLANWSIRHGVIAHNDPTICIEKLRVKEETQKTQQKKVCA